MITHEQAENLISQLARLKDANPNALIENLENTIVDKTTYYERNSEVVNASDRLIAFHIKSESSEGSGTLDTINRAKQKGIPVKVYSYNLTEDK